LQCPAPSAGAGERGFVGQNKIARGVGQLRVVEQQGASIDRKSAGEGRRARREREGAAAGFGQDIRVGRRGKRTIKTHGIGRRNMDVGGFGQMHVVGQHSHRARCTRLEPQRTEHAEVFVLSYSAASAAGQTERTFEEIIARIARRAEAQLPARLHGVVGHPVRCDSRFGECEHTLLDGDIAGEGLARAGDARHAGATFDHRPRTRHHSLQAQRAVFGIG